MKQHKGFGSPQKTKAFTLAILESPSPGVHTVAVRCPHGTFAITAWPTGLFLSDEQLPHIAPGCLDWLTKNRDAIGAAIYGQAVEVRP